MIQAKACHILLIPINTSHENVENTRTKLQIHCKQYSKLCVTVRTLNEYIYNYNMETNSSEIFFPFTHHISKYDRELFRQLVCKLAPIRFYLIGNDLRFTLTDRTEWGKIFRSGEKSKGSDVWKYLINEPIHDTTKEYKDLSLGLERLIKDTLPIQLNEILTNDLHNEFCPLIERVHSTLDDRSNTVTRQLIEWSTAHVQLRIEIG
ncbi:unnamed protein product, partial [Didymodactylos carnosus]